MSRPSPFWCFFQPWALGRVILKKDAILQLRQQDFSDSQSEARFAQNMNVTIVTEPMIDRQKVNTVQDVAGNA